MLKRLFLATAIALPGFLTATNLWAADTNVVVLENTAVKPVPRDAGWVKRHEGLVAEVKKGGYDLVYLGDSITDGWTPHKPSAEQEARQKVWDTYYGKRHALNLGIGGDRTEHVLWRLENGEWDGIKPKLVVLMIGTNNTKANTAEEIAEGIKAIVQEIRTKTPETKILLLAIFPRGPKPNPQREKNAEASKIASKLADDKHVYYLDIGPKFLDAEGNLSPDIMPDYLHPNAKGYEIWAEAVEPKIAELMGDKPITSKSSSPKAATNGVPANGQK